MSLSVILPHVYQEMVLSYFPTEEMHHYIQKHKVLDFLVLTVLLEVASSVFHHTVSWINTGLPLHLQQVSYADTPHWQTKNECVVFTSARRTILKVPLQYSLPFLNGACSSMCFPSNAPTQ